MDIISSLDKDEPLIYRRATIIEVSGDRVTAEMEDDFHHFRIMLGHDGGVITSIAGESIRFPWTTCGLESARKMQELAGCRLASLYEQLSSDERFSYCTHMFDLVQLAINHAREGESTLLYEAAITVVPTAGAVSAELLCDGEPLLTWTLHDGIITSPAPYKGLKISGLSAWARQQSQTRLTEAVLLLQRAIHVSVGKIFNWSTATLATEMNLPPTCYTFQLDTAARSDRVPGNIRDFTHSATQMLGGKSRR